MAIFNSYVSLPEGISNKPQGHLILQASEQGQAGVPWSPAHGRRQSTQGDLWEEPSRGRTCRGKIVGFLGFSWENGGFSWENGGTCSLKWEIVRRSVRIVLKNDTFCL